MSMEISDVSQNNVICDVIFHRVNVMSMASHECQYGIIENTTVVIHHGRFVHVGTANQSLQETPYTANEVIDGDGQWLLPGFIDCHTHLVFGGNRAHEFEQRLNGVSYAEIARQGGGIQSTVHATRHASEDELLAGAIERSYKLLKEGVTSIEVKSGYGLDKDNELKMLRVARAIPEHLPMTVKATYLGAHAIPAEYKENRDAYLDLVCHQVMPAVAQEKLADAVDVFCESIGFTLEETRRVFECAQQLGLPVKAHVEQLSDMKGAKLASQYHALSVDHIEYLAIEDMPTLQQASTVAVILPGAFYYLNETQRPPIQALRDHHIPMAVATDLNPGSSPMVSLLTAMNMACVLFSMTPAEVMRGVTVNAAKALALPMKGKIAPDYDADFSLWAINHPAEIVYSLNGFHPEQVWVGGQHVTLG